MPTIEGRCLIDTNVLIYATLGNDPRHAAARKVLEDAAAPAVQAYVSAQNLSEMYPNLTGPKNQPPDSPEQARTKILAIAGLPHLTVLPVTADVVADALELAVRLHAARQRIYDLQLAALMRMHGIPTIITEDTRGFEGVDGIRTINPFT